MYGANIYTYAITVIDKPSIETILRRVSCYSYDALATTSKLLLNGKYKWEVYYQGQLKRTFLDQDSIRFNFDSSGTYIFKFTFSNSGCLITHFDT